MMPKERKLRTIISISTQLSTVIENRRKSILRLMILKNTLFDMFSRGSGKFIAEKEITDIVDEARQILDKSEEIRPEKRVTILHDLPEYQDRRGR